MTVSVAVVRLATPSLVSIFAIDLVSSVAASLRVVFLGQGAVGPVQAGN